MADYGRLWNAPGVEGPPRQRNLLVLHLRSAQDFLKVNDEIECMILGIDREGRKMSSAQATTQGHGPTSSPLPVESKRKARCATSPTASSSSWKKASTVWSTSLTSAGPRRSSTPLSSATWGRNRSRARTRQPPHELDTSSWKKTHGSLQRVRRAASTKPLWSRWRAVTRPSRFYGLEGTCHSKHLVKQDAPRSAWTTNEFVVLEFNHNKRITVSHLRTTKKDLPSLTHPRSLALQVAVVVVIHAHDGRGQCQRRKEHLGDLDVLTALKEHGGQSEEEAKEARRLRPRRRLHPRGRLHPKEGAAKKEEAAEEAPKLTTLLLRRKHPG